MEPASNGERPEAAYTTVAAQENTSMGVSTGAPVSRSGAVKAGMSTRRVALLESAAIACAIPTLITRGPSGPRITLPGRMSPCTTPA